MRPQIYRPGEKQVPFAQDLVYWQGMADFKMLSDEELEQYPIFTQLEWALTTPHQCYQLELGPNVTSSMLEAALPQLPRVQTLVIDSNQHLQELPDSVGSLRHLGFLEIRNAALESLPQSIAALEHMTDLVISDCPNFKVLPDFICDWPDMVYLEVSNCAIEALPLAIGQLSQLEDLNIDQNKIRELPESLGQLHSLQTLRTYGNFAMYLSAPVFKQLRSLQAFDHGLIQFRDGTLEEVQAALPDCQFSAITNFDTLPDTW